MRRNQSPPTGKSPPPPAPYRRVVAVTVVLLSLALAGCHLRSLEDRSAQAGPATPGADRSPQVLERVSAGMVTIDATLHLTDGSEQRRGSGFLVSETGHVLTVYSLIAPEDGQEVTARFIEVTLRPGMDAAQTVPAELERTNPQLGLALLKVAAATPAYLRAVLADSLGEGDVVWAATCPSALGVVAIEAATIAGGRELGGAPLLELSLPGDPSRSGGALVDAEGRAMGVLLPAQADMPSQCALSYAAVAAWLATDPAEDPAPSRPGAAVMALLEEAELQNDGSSDGVFTVPYDNGVEVLVHQTAEYLRVYVPLGLFDPQTGLKALACNYYDPAGKLSAHTQGDEERIVWEAQVPMSVATADYLKLLTRVGANQAVRWRALLQGNQPEDWYDLYPGGEEPLLRPRLQAVLKVALGDEFEVSGKSFKILRGDVTVWASVFRGMAWLRCNIGGMPGADPQAQLVNAADCLSRNWRDPLGRLSLDEHNDLSWEAQVPVEMLTPELLEKILADGELQVEAIWSRYGHVPFNEESDDS